MTSLCLDFFFGFLLGLVGAVCSAASFFVALSSDEGRGFFFFLKSFFGLSEKDFCWRFDDEGFSTGEIAVGRVGLVAALANEFGKTFSFCGNAGAFDDFFLRSPLTFFFKGTFERTAVCTITWRERRDFQLRRGSFVAASVLINSPHCCRQAVSQFPLSHCGLLLQSSASGLTSCPGNEYLISREEGKEGRKSFL